MQLLLNCINENTISNQSTLREHIHNVVGEKNREKVSHNKEIYNYFSKSSSEGAYLIAEEYIIFIASLATEGKIPVPQNYIIVYNDDKKGRVPSALEENNRLAKHTICDNSNIYLSNLYEYGNLIQKFL